MGSDEEKKEGVQAKNDAETLCYQVEKQLTELKEKMSTADADDLRKKMEDVRQTMASDGADPEEIKAKTKELQEASWKVTQQAYQQSDSSDSSEKKEEAEDKKEEKK